MIKAVYFDMDGTVADLYGVQDWEYKLRNNDATPYSEAQPLCDMAELNALLFQFAQLGIIIGVISWLAMNSTKDYDAKVRSAKREWLARNMPCVSELHFVKYGTNKKSVAKIKESILVDDNKNVRDTWDGITIDANGNILADLKKILDNLQK